MYHGVPKVKFFDGLTLGGGLPYWAWAYVAIDAREGLAAAGKRRRPPDLLHIGSEQKP